MLISAAIQAGGLSNRMGRDKALVLLSEIPLIEHVSLCLKSLSDERFVIAPADRDYHFLGLPIYSDPIPGVGALGGLYAALYFARGKFVINAACDMPFLSHGLFKFLSSQMEEKGIDVAIPWPESGPEPMHAVYRRETCLPAVYESLKNGEQRMISWHGKVKVEQVPQEVLNHYDPDGHCFWNINTPEDLINAERFIQEL